MVTDFAVVQAMHKFGGSFVKALAQAFDAADAENIARLKMAFPEYWLEYSDMAEIRHRNGNGPR